MADIDTFLRVLEIVIWPITISRLVRVVLQWLMDLHTSGTEEEREEEKGS